MLPSTTLITVSSLGLLFLSCHIIVIKGNHDNALQQMFADRTRQDWEAAWHVEKHRRCYQELVSHMELVCRHDIYNLMMKKRTDQGPTFELLSKPRHFQPSEITDNSNKLSPTYQELDADLPDDGIFLTFKEASSFWRSSKPSGLGRRIKRAGIMDECCSEVGCSWEEYAEYCPTNRRMRNRS